MKVIDLLNKIANGEEHPKEIKYPMGDCEEFYLRNLYERLFDEDVILNDEVEVIEDNKKIERPLCCHIQRGIKLNKEDLSRIAIQNKENIKNIYDKLVEIIEVLNDKD